MDKKALSLSKTLGKMSQVIKNNLSFCLNFPTPHHHQVPKSPLSMDAFFSMVNGQSISSIFQEISDT